MKESTRQSYTQRMLKVLVHIQNNLDEDLKLEELADLACFSPFHFHRVFKGMVGEGLAAHLRRLRLERAAWQLRTTGISVTGIAFGAGYETVESFTRAFSRSHGVPPSLYRYRDGPAGRHGFPSQQELIQRLMERMGVKMDAKIVKNDAIRLAFVRHMGPYDKCETAWEKLCTHMGPLGLLGPDTTFLGLCHDDPEVTPPQNIRYDACIKVGPEFQPSGEVGVQEIPAGDYAMVLHKGPYSTLKESYAALAGQWLPNSGREPKNAPSHEVYLNHPEDTPPEELLTEIYVPLA